MATYSEEDLIKAVDAVKFGNLSLWKASKIYNIPQATLFKKKNAVFVEIERKGPCTVLTADEEEGLVLYINLSNIV